MNSASFPPTKSGPRRLRSIALSGLACAPLLLGGCSVFAPIPEPRGSLIEKVDYSQLVPGTSTRSDVLDLLGSPTSHATFDDNRWIYISMVTLPVPMGFPAVAKQQVVVLSFDNSGVLRKLETLNRHDAVHVGMVSETTPAPGTKTSIIQQLLGNVGKYNPMSGMGSTFGGTTGPMSNQGTGQGGHGNTLP